MCVRKRMEQSTEVLLSDMCSVNASGSCFFSHSMLIKRGQKRREKGKSVSAEQRMTQCFIS